MLHFNGLIDPKCRDVTGSTNAWVYQPVSSSKRLEPQQSLAAVCFTGHVLHHVCVCFAVAQHVLHVERPSLKRVPEAVCSSVWWQNRALLLLICTADPRYKPFPPKHHLYLSQGALTRLPNLFQTNLNLSPQQLLTVVGEYRPKFWSEKCICKHIRKEHNRVRYKFKMRYCQWKSIY